MNITVQDIRDLSVKFKKDVCIVFAWDATSNETQIVTVGSTRDLADLSYELSKKMAEHAGLVSGPLLEDRRHDHLYPWEET